MTSGPYPFGRQMAAVDQVLAGVPDWEGLSQAFYPVKTADNFDPGTDMKQVLFHLYGTLEGRRIIEWLADLTVRAPYPHVGQSKDSVMIAAAKHEARVGVGLVLFRAIADGEELYKQSKGATT
ncbi:hypothetical protein [Mesorhizobium sp. M8A.F.Ca.ET.021.01.1.1]|uniref:hypothetical protein n=1 Tax=Mesorhizobium sp. M8A.F.Ca.ET.021.01.1.1 TaxID=2496757 RepID=UPI000FCBCA27|nr:hypothetical protein [Mesorhizobium sp. M8A.F.Ca.ET.021.01.1.1]RUW46088.1 hypothetical protein EOA36_26465 [Mesorhizobium sp. M8A.F.Ca.ET.021.01.1.1]